MVQVRRAVVPDAVELVRLRALMFEAMGEDDDEGWREPCRRAIEERIAAAAGDFVAYVVDAPDGGLAAGAIGIVERRLPGPRRPDGRVGLVSSVSTDRRHRRRGYARAVLTALVAWFDDAGVRRVELHATGDGEALYRSLGFTESRWPGLRRDT